MIKPNLIIKKVKNYIIYSKLKIIAYAKADSRRLAIKKFNIPEQALSDLFKNENKFIEASNKNVTTLHKGRELLNEEVEKKIIEHKFNRKLLNPITVVSLIVKLTEL